jgi:hypothetical protein
MAKDKNTEKKDSSKNNEGKTQTNKHGLSRYIPTDVRLQVRQKYGFGCVICGNAFIDYEHFDPEFVDCTEHDPDGIILLCPSHHSRKTRKFLPREIIEKALRDPAALKNGFSYDTINLVDSYPEIRMGGSTFKKVPIPIQFQGEPILKIRPPEVSGSPYLISAKFYNEYENVVMEIQDNEWKTFPKNWDVTVKGGVISIFDSKNKPCLIINVQHKDLIIIEYIKFKKGKYLLEGDAQKMTFTNTQTKSVMELVNVGLENLNVGINL